MAALKNYFRVSKCSVFAVISAVLSLLNAVNGELIFSHLPQHVNLNKNSGEIKISEVPGVLSLLMGFTPNKDIEWNGLLDSDPFKRPAASVTFTVTAAADAIKPHSKAASFNTNVDIPFISVDQMINHIQRTFIGETPLIVDLTADRMLSDLKNVYPVVFEDLPTSFDEMLVRLHRSASILETSLNRTRKPDNLLLVELQTITELLNSLKSHAKLTNDRTPDVFNFEIKSLDRIESEYGVDSLQVKDAKKLLNKFFETVTEQFSELYNGNVVVSVITLLTADAALVRKSRSLMAAADPTQAPKKPNLNLAADYGYDFPVMFNIILWMMVVLGVTVFGISVCMWHMDPGRDSIIYRMTNTRMKKD
ncbi:renin receptor-like [Tubulanus polymorphus]|uniref:renin receptor-like n=1 Tax=Tubulanus polymorphus TaxID=672921 RepID=UPI003DA57142